MNASPEKKYPQLYKVFLDKGIGVAFLNFIVWAHVFDEKALSTGIDQLKKAGVKEVYFDWDPKEKKATISVTTDKVRWQSDEGMIGKFNMDKDWEKSLLEILIKAPATLKAEKK
jgi:hypothetical protein